MVILVSALLLALLVSLTIRVYRKNWNKNLTLSIAFASDAVFEGDQGELCETVANRKLLPLWWSDIRFELSDFIRFDDEGMGGRLYKKNTVSAFSYEMVKKTFAFTAAKRGYYTISGAELLTGDLFFRYKFIRRFPVSTGLYVYPDIRGVRRFSVDFRKIVGEAVVRRHMIEDPFEFRGIRDYSPFDSLRAVNWNATAKTGEIKVNEYSCTSSQEVLLLLDFDGYNDWDRQEIKEDVIRIAAYLAQKLIDNGIPVGLACNAGDSVTREEPSLPCESGSNQSLRIFRQLARLDTDLVTRPFTEVIDSSVGSARGPHCIFISWYAKEDLQLKLAALGLSGHSLQWIFVKGRDSEAPPPRANLTVCEADY